MNKNATVRARVDEISKKKAEIIFSKLGLTTSGAIDIFFKQVVRHQGLPFSMKLNPSEIENETQYVANNPVLKKKIEDGLKELKSGKVRKLKPE